MYLHSRSSIGIVLSASFIDAALAGASRVGTGVTGISFGFRKTFCRSACLRETATLSEIVAA